jgi:hypothetical protein
MTATRLLTQLTELGINLTLEGETLKVSPKSKLTPDLVESLKANKQQMMILLRGQSEDIVTLVTPPYEQDLKRLERLLGTGRYAGRNYELVRHYLELHKRGDTRALEGLLAYLEREDVQKLLWTVN